MSIRKGNDEYILAQTERKRRLQKRDFHWTTPLEFTCRTRSTIRDAKNILKI